MKNDQQIKLNWGLTLAICKWPVMLNYLTFLLLPPSLYTWCVSTVYVCMNLTNLWTGIKEKNEAEEENTQCTYNNTSTTFSCQYVCMKTDMCHMCLIWLGNATEMTFPLCVHSRTTNTDGSDMPLFPSLSLPDNTLFFFFIYMDRCTIEAILLRLVYQGVSVREKYHTDICYCSCKGLRMTSTVNEKISKGFSE